MLLSGESLNPASSPSDAEVPDRPCEKDFNEEMIERSTSEVNTVSTFRLLVPLHAIQCNCSFTDTVYATFQSSYCGFTSKSHLFSASIKPSHGCEIDN